MPENRFYGTGRRKNAIARVWLLKGQKGVAINGREAMEYLKRENLLTMVEKPLKTVKLTEDFKIRAQVHGGGVAGQAGAISLGVARALIQYNESLRPALRREGVLTRDPREKERKKPGRKGARRSFQYTKR
ncbi:MAG: 30S ribosomal protein S9 [Candidatus Omnitrophota bacterium]|jgi:small subunit ribosomal protein S9